jgi:hypothetical protein
MKNLNSKISALLLAAFLLTMPSIGFADAPKGEGETWQKAFRKKISYNGWNKDILKGSVVVLEIKIDEKGLVVVQNCNASNPEAADYLKKKLDGTQVGSLPEEDTFIIKYIFR